MALLNVVNNVSVASIKVVKIDEFNLEMLYKIDTLFEILCQ